MIGQALSGEPAPMTPDEQGVAKFASTGLAASLPQQAAVVPQAPPVQVADAGSTVPPQVLQQMLANPRTRGIAEKYIQQKMKPAAPTGATEYGLIPQYARDAKGNIRPYVMGKNGLPKFIDLPEGAQAMAPGDLAAEKSAGRERGEVMGKNQGNLPAMENNAQKMVRDIDNLINDPYLSRMLGPIDSRLPNLSADSGRVQARIDQIQGKTFLQAFDSLRGAGQITESEGEKATQSLNRLQATQVGTKDFYEAAEEFKKDIQDLLLVARQKASGDGMGGWQDVGNGVRIREKR